MQSNNKNPYFGSVLPKTGLPVLKLRETYVKQDFKRIYLNN